MEAVKSYVMCVLLAASIAGILKNVSSGMKNFEKYVGLICSLSVIIVLASPLASVIASVKDSFDSDGSLIGNVQKDPSEEKNSHEIMSEHVKSALEYTIKDILCRRFSIDALDINVSAAIGEDGGVEKITVDVYTDIDTSAIKSYVENNMCISAEIRRERQK